MTIYLQAKRALRHALDKRPLQRAHQRRDIPIYTFAHHKSGSAFLTSIFRKVSKLNGWKFQRLLGHQADIPHGFDVVQFSHSMVASEVLESPFVGVHIIRDPRSIIASGYSYHRRTTEEWCVNDAFDIDGPILFPQVPYSQEHVSESWKREYLADLGGRSYQQNLLELPQQEGMLFEMERYGAWTIEAMRAWDYGRSNILELKFEDVMSDFDSSLQRIFEHVGFAEPDLSAAMKIARAHDLDRKSAREIESMKHVSSTKPSSWTDFFDDDLKTAFKARFGDVLVELGYETDNDW